MDNDRDDRDDAIADADDTGLVDSEKLITEAETLEPLIELEKETKAEEDAPER